MTAERWARLLRLARQRHDLLAEATLTGSRHDRRRQALDERAAAILAGRAVAWGAAS